MPRLGPKAYEQAAGFLRIGNGSNPLDASSVHPEAYPIAEHILNDLGESVHTVMKKPQLLKAVNAAKYVDDQFGLPTIQDILAELEKPGRDPRPEFKTANFNDAVNEIKDLKEDMILEGVVTNVTNFGAFVDLGVHQDGLVHISALADKFVKDPHDVVSTGDIVKVKVLEVDVERKRIALTMRLSDSAERHDKRNKQQSNGAHEGKRGRNKQPKKRKTDTNVGAGSAMAQAFANAKKKNK